MDRELGDGLTRQAMLRYPDFTAIHVYDPPSNPLREAFGPGLAEVGLILWAGFLAEATATLNYADLARGAEALGAQLSPRRRRGARSGRKTHPLAEVTPP